jgi:hypothetical protein
MANLKFSKQTIWGSVYHLEVSYYGCLMMNPNVDWLHVHVVTSPCLLVIPCVDRVRLGPTQTRAAGASYVALPSVGSGVRVPAGCTRRIILRIVTG